MSEKVSKEDRPAFLAPLIAVLTLTLIVLLTNLDKKVSNLFFNESTSTWPYGGTWIQQMFYKFSPVPAIIVFAVAVVIAVGFIWRPQWRRMRRGAIYWCLLMVLGPGLIVNAVFKEWYGRPRPVQTVEYGGDMEFCPVWVVGSPTKAKSFPCGHASVGFYFFAGYFFWWRKNRRLARTFLYIGLIFGSVIGFSRILNGSHWLSDVLWSGTFIYVLSYLMANVFGYLEPLRACE